MTTLKIDLADILTHRLQFGFTIPVPIDVEQLLEHADDDWEHELDLDRVLAERRQAAVLLDAARVHARYPHLTADQAWEVTQILAADLRMFAEDAIDDAVHINFPSTRMQLHTRLMNLRYSLQARKDAAAEPLLNEVKGLERLFYKLPDSFAESNPALEGSLAAALDDIEKAAQEGGAA